MNWIRQIDAAMRRGKSPYSTAEAIRWMLSADHPCTLAIGDHMTASARLFEGQAQIVHVGGKWNKEDAIWLKRRLRAKMKQWGVDTIRIDGRPGWARFLKKEGFEL